MRKTTILIILISLFFLNSAILAAARWTDGGTDSVWTNAENWDENYGNAPPLASDTTFIRNVDISADGQGPVVTAGMDIEISMTALKMLKILSGVCR